MILRFCSWFARAFGSARCFTICGVLLVVWLACIPILGLAHWNASLGLGGNTAESTVELFLAIATLYVANTIDRRHDDQLARIEEILTHLKENNE